MNDTTHQDDDNLDAVFFALASEPRRRMLDILKEQPGSNVNQICAHLDAEMTRFAVMKHLNTLEKAGLVISEKVGREKLLWFDPTPIQWIHQRWTTEFSAYWAARLTRLKFAAEGAEILPLKTKGKGSGHG